jgi:glucose-6-phosphate isomerase
MLRISTQKEVVKAVNAESALENAAATIPMLKTPNTIGPRYSLAR